MAEYRIEYICDNGYEGKMTVCAMNRTMAFMIFEDFEIEGVVSAECYRVVDKGYDTEDEEEYYV